MLNVLGSILYWASALYTLVLLLRVVFDWVRLFAPRWVPRGPLIVIANWTYALTDPPLRFMRRFIPPLRLGGVALDVGFLVVFLGVSLLSRLALFMIGLGR